MKLKYRQFSICSGWIFEIIIILLLSIFIGSLSFSNSVLGDLNYIDEGQFAAWANHMFQGKHMYKDFFIAYGPLLVYPLYILFKIFVPTVFLVRLYLAVINASGVMLGNLLMYKLGIPKFIRGIFILLLILIPVLGIRQGMGFLVIFLAFTSIENKKILWSFFTGVFVALSFFLSSEIGISSFLLVCLIYLYKIVTVRNTGNLLKKIIFIFLGIFLVSGFFVFWPVKEGWFGAYAEMTKDVLVSFSGIELPNGQNFPNILVLMPFGKSFFYWFKFIFIKDLFLYWLIVFYAMCLFYLIIKVFLKQASKTEGMLGIITIYGILLYLITIGRSGIGHFFFVLSPAMILASYYCENLLQVIKSRKHVIGDRILAGFLFVIIIIFGIRLISVFRPHFSRALKLPYAIISAKNNPDRVGNIYISNQQKIQIKTIENFMRYNTTKTDKIFFLNDEPMMYFLTDRLNPTRYDMPFVSDTIEKRLEVLYDLVNDPPRYIIEDKSAWAVDGVNNKNRLPEVYDYIKKNYSVSETINTFIIYRYNSI